ncbi:plastocyanin [Saccharomonospora amisosensis]|uniref:Plastocyanin n=1 Tax=Saccharomonospora amisosensis TaxID=1128677 RepID=A0A7X5ZR05_9PSEU|nr:chitobiase/beta-hexosaminidase C-terminal domain-containing protein [Saccharomonospora amisosensis]NIJ12384.1 plastocyanin [Saccharomonospora amisosensis]
MYSRLPSATPRKPGPIARLRAAAGRFAVAILGLLVATLWLAPASAAQRTPEPAAETALAQVLTWTANDSITSYASAPSTATAGAATIVFENSTATGNTTGLPHTLTFDTSTPGYNHDVDVNILASPFDANEGRYEVNVNLSPGEYRYYCDMPGHGQMTGVLVVTGDGSDTTAPEVSAEVTGQTDDQGNYLGSATVAVTATDAGSGVASVEYEIDDTGFQPYTGPVTVDRVGDHSVQYRATDNAGNTSPTGSVQFSVVEPDPGDTTPPEVSAEVGGQTDGQGGYVGSATVTVAANDTGSGVASVEYELDGGGFRTYSAPVVVDTVGEHIVRYRATDNAGNASQAGSVSFTVVPPEPGDTTPPRVIAEVAGEQDAGGNYLGSATVTLAAQDAESEVDSVEYAIGAGAFQAYTTPVTFDRPGEYTVRYRATDTAGNTSQPGSVSFAVVEPPPDDTTAPEVSAEVNGETDGQGNYVGSATVTISATDARSGIAAVEYALDGEGFTEYTQPIVVNQAGEHTVRYRAGDNAGNTSEVGSVAFTVVEADPGDTTPPEVSAEVNGETDERGDYVGSATVTISATDARSGIAAVEYAVDEGEFRLYEGPVTVDRPGEHTVRYRATDNAENTAEGAVSFIVVVDPTDACPDSDERPTVTIGDYDTGVANVDTGNGCTINDLIAEDAEYANHGEFVDHVQALTRELVAAGIITDGDRGRIVSAAARSDVGK